MKLALRQLSAILFFLIVSMLGNLALAQEPQTTPQPKQVAIGEIFKSIGDSSSDWCRSTFVTASVFNYVNTFVKIKAKEVQIQFAIYHNANHESEELSAIAKNYRNTQSLLNISYAICFAAPKYVSLVTSP